MFAGILRGGGAMTDMGGLDSDASEGLPEAHHAPAPPPLPPSAKAPNYFVRHWRGELSLGVSYWVNGFLATFAAIAAVGAIAASLGSLQSNYMTLAVGVTSWTAIGAISLWQLVGIWRSASRPGEDGKLSRWAGAVKFAVVLGLIRTVLSFATEGAPTISAAARQALWLNEYAKWSVRLLRDGSELEVSGGIGHGFAKDITAALVANPSVRLVHLNLGSGGLVDEAKQAREVVRARKVFTYVSRQCVSACTFAFLGGERRYLKSGAKLGFHAPSMPLAVGYEAEKIRQGERQFLVNAGVSPAFSARVIATPAESMWFPSSEELIEAGVVTEVVSGDSFAMSGAAVPTLEALSADLEKVALYRALKKADPATFEKVVRASHDAQLRGTSMAELRSVTLPLLQPVYARSLPMASDDALFTMGSWLVANLRELQRAPGQVCVGYINADSAAREEALSFISKATKEQELEVMAQVMDSAALGRPVASEAQQEVLFPKVFEHARRIVGEDIQAIQDLQNPRADKAKLCRAMLGLFSGVMNLPKKDAAMMLRMQFSSN